jgi:hypothetical protein
MAATYVAGIRNQPSFPGYGRPDDLPSQGGVPDPAYECLPNWRIPTSAFSEYTELPKAAREYQDFPEEKAALRSAGFRRAEPDSVKKESPAR